MQFRNPLVAAATVVVAVASFSANAAAVHWTLDNVTLSDGQTLTGSFDYDRDTNRYSNISVANSGSAIWEATLFTRTQPGRGNWVWVGLDDGTPAVGDIILTLQWNQFGGELTNAGGVVMLNQPFTAFGRCTSADCMSWSVSGAEMVNVIGGQLTAVPVPAAALLFGSGLVGLIGVMRRTPRRL